MKWPWSLLVNPGHGFTVSACTLDKSCWKWLECLKLLLVDSHRFRCFYSRPSRFTCREKNPTFLMHFPVFWEIFSFRSKSSVFVWSFLWHGRFISEAVSWKILSLFRCGDGSGVCSWYIQFILHQINRLHNVLKRIWYAKRKIKYFHKIVSLRHLAWKAKKNCTQSAHQVEIIWQFNTWRKSAQELRVKIYSTFYKWYKYFCGFASEVCTTG